MRYIMKETLGHINPSFAPCAGREYHPQIFEKGYYKWHPVENFLGSKSAVFLSEEKGLKYFRVRCDSSKEIVNA